MLRESFSVNRFLLAEAGFPQHLFALFSNGCAYRCVNSLCIKQVPHVVLRRRTMYLCETAIPGDEDGHLLWLVENWGWRKSSSEFGDRLPIPSAITDAPLPCPERNHRTRCE